MMDFALASVILARLTDRALELFVISATSSGYSAQIGRAPTAKTAFAQSLIAIGLVMQWIKGASLCN
jgi:hypothetical protein